MGRASPNAAESSAKRDFVEALIGTLHNVVRRVPTSRNSFRQNQAVDIVQKYRDVTEYPASLPINRTHTHPFSGPFSRTTQVSRYQKGKTNLDFTEAKRH